MGDATPRPDVGGDVRGAQRRERRALALLGAGAALGLAAAALGLMRGDAGPRPLPDTAVAAVNGEVVRVEAYARAVEAFAADRREPLGEDERRHVLDRLVDEELLVQRGLELGLARHDRRVRSDLVSAVIQLVLQQAEADALSAREVEAFYAEHRDYFARTGRFLARQVLIRAAPHRSEDEARERAMEAAAGLRAGEPFADVDARLGDPQVARLPADHLPVAKLREYLGPTATRALVALEQGDTSDPVRSATGYHVLQLLGREEGSVPPLAEIEDEVRAELVRRGGDRALREYLDELRERADVRIAPALP